MKPIAELSGLDSGRFGIRIAKAFVSDIRDVRLMAREAAELRAAMVIIRTPASALDAAHELERLGGSLMDVLIYCARGVSAPDLEDVGTVNIRTMRSEDVDSVVDIARASFRGYLGHYHTDERLPKHLADEVYISWTERSCRSREVADEVLIADAGKGPIGFMTFRANSPEEGEAIIGGVMPRAQGRGIYRSLLVRGMGWCHARGMARMVVSTQITNVAVQRVWARLGFEPQKSFLTFHLWMDRLTSAPGR